MFRGTMIANLFSDPVGALTSILIALPGILIGLTVHEWAHAFVAYKLGDPTARNLGRMTLNPVAHVDLFGILCLLIAGFGWAKPVPVNPRNFKNYRRDDVLVSMAGIVMNLLVAFVATIAFYFLFFAGMKNGMSKVMSIVTSIFQSIAAINLSLAVFNLIPVYPLDGSHVLDVLLMRKAPKVCNFLHSYGRYILLLLLFTGIASGVLGTVVNWIYSGYSKVALALVNLVF